MACVNVGITAILKIPFELFSIYNMTYYNGCHIQYVLKRRIDIFHKNTNLEIIRKETA